MVGLNPVTLRNSAGITATIQSGEKRLIVPGDRIEIVKDDPKLRFVLLEGDGGPVSVPEVSLIASSALLCSKWRSPLSSPVAVTDVSP